MKAVWGQYPQYKKEISTKDNYMYVSDIIVNEAIDYFNKGNVVNVADDARYLSESEYKQFLKRYKGNLDELHITPVYTPKKEWFMFYEISHKDNYERYSFLYYSSPDFDEEFYREAFDRDQVRNVFVNDKGEKVITYKDLANRYGCAVSRAQNLVKQNKEFPDGRVWRKI